MLNEIVTCRTKTVPIGTIRETRTVVLRIFVVEIGTYGRPGWDAFVVAAENTGMAWQVVMSRYGVDDPRKLPTPRQMVPAPMSFEESELGAPQEIVHEQTRRLSMEEFSGLLNRAKKVV